MKYDKIRIYKNEISEESYDFLMWQIKNEFDDFELKTMATFIEELGSYYEIRFIKDGAVERKIEIDNNDHLLKSIKKAFNAKQKDQIEKEKLREQAPQIEANQIAEKGNRIAWLALIVSGSLVIWEIVSRILGI